MNSDEQAAYQVAFPKWAKAWKTQNDMKPQSQRAKNNKGAAKAFQKDFLKKYRETHLTPSAPPPTTRAPKGSPARSRDEHDNFYLPAFQQWEPKWRNNHPEATGAQYAYALTDFNTVWLKERNYVGGTRPARFIQVENGKWPLPGTTPPGWPASAPPADIHPEDLGVGRELTCKSLLDLDRPSSKLEAAVRFNKSVDCVREKSLSKFEEENAKRLAEADKAYSEVQAAVEVARGTAGAALPVLATSGGLIICTEVAKGKGTRLARRRGSKCGSATKCEVEQNAEFSYYTAADIKRSVNRAERAPCKKATPKKKKCRKRDDTSSSSSSSSSTC